MKHLYTNGRFNHIGTFHFYVENLLNNYYVCSVIIHLIYESFKRSAILWLFVWVFKEKWLTLHID